MNKTPIVVKDGITLFKGKFSRNLLFEPIVSNVYLLDDGDEAIIFDPSCGKKMATIVEAYIKNRIKVSGKWKKGVLIAGHSHLDHANNFCLSDAIGAQECSIYVHENGFKDGKVMNSPKPFIDQSVQESMSYYNYYMSFPFPYSVPMYIFAALNALSPALARKLFAILGSIPWPPPRDGTAKATALRNADAKVINIGGLEVRGWKIGDKVIMPTPGHSPCSVSLYWAEKKALLISDADWIGNPVFMAASIKDSIASLNKIMDLTNTGHLELLLPAHGDPKEGAEQILSHLRLRVSLLESIREEVMAAYRSYGQEKDVRKLAKILTQASTLFILLRIVNYPRHVFFLHNIVAVCLREEGLLN